MSFSIRLIKRNFLNVTHLRSNSTRVPKSNKSKQNHLSISFETGKRLFSTSSSSSSPPPSDNLIRSEKNDIQQNENAHVHFDLIAKDGAKVALHEEGPKDGTRVLLVAGLYCDHRFWMGTKKKGLSSFLANNGFRCFTLDNRGHGHSQHKPNPGAAPFLYEDWITDVRMSIKFIANLPTNATPENYAVDFSKDQTNGVVVSKDQSLVQEKQKIFVIGHSAGSVSAMCALSDKQVETELVRGLIAMSIMYPNYDLWHRISVHFARGLILIFKKFPARLFRWSNEDEVGSIAWQWFGWQLKGKFYGPREQRNYMDSIKKLELPLLKLAGGGDWLWSPPAKCKLFFDQFTMKDKTFMICGKQNGFSKDYGHPDIVVSKNAQKEIWPMLTKWMNDHK